MMINTDKGQFEQVLLNLIKNTKEAQNSNKEISQSKNIDIQAFKTGQQTIIKVLDQGCGIANTANLFAPFYTTKATGSGIGLALSRQITNH
jgi:C4-dicarboxylate-specific signal transduction histidine kinase